MSKKSLSMLFDGGYGKCPICKRAFKSDACPHSFTQAESRIKDERVKSVIKREMRRYRNP